MTEQGLTSPLAVFRADASPDIGGGHAMRCLALAKELEKSGWRCAFAVNDLAVDFVPWPAAPDRDIAVACDSGELQRHWPGGADLLVVDHYGLDAEFETLCRGWTRRIMVIDDLADRTHDCDVLVDPTADRTKEDYRGLVGDHCRLLLGSRFALLRAGFRDTVPKRRNRDRTGTRIVIGFGLSDPHNMTERAIQGIAATGLEARLDVALGVAAPTLPRLRDVIADSPLDITLHPGAEDIERLFAEADIAVGAAGGMCWERCAMALASVVVVTADNQRHNAAALDSHGAAVVLGTQEDVGPQEIGQAVATLAGHPEDMKHMSKQARSLCDGLGTVRIAEALNV